MKTTPLSCGFSHAWSPNGIDPTPDGLYQLISTKGDKIRNDACDI